VHHREEPTFSRPVHDERELDESEHNSHPKRR
jgi:hypothetical protein